MFCSGGILHWMRGHGLGLGLVCIEGRRSVWHRTGTRIVSEERGIQYLPLIFSWGIHLKVISRI
jgi:hypothetical protein